jgi:hypothetical protein
VSRTTISLAQLALVIIASALPWNSLRPRDNADADGADRCEARVSKHGTGEWLAGRENL